MTTAATISAKLVLDSSQFTKGIKQAGKQVDGLSGKLSRLDTFLRNNNQHMQDLGTGMMRAGQKMSMLVSVPIIGFLGLVIKKALDANTALSKMATESLGKLNASLAKLGEKFLPLLIRLIDWLTLMIDKFLAADPATQKFITMLAALAAMAGPVIALTGWLINTVAFLGSLGVTLTTAGTALAGFGAVITGTLIPALLAILPILALIILTVGLVYMVWSNWEQLSTTVFQLWEIIKHYWLAGVNAIVGMFKSIKAVADTVNMGIFNAFFGTIIKIGLAIYKFVLTAKKAWSDIGSAFSSVFNAIVGIASGVFNSIAAGIAQLIAYVYELIAAFGAIVLPDALTPGSPTPFELGLRGISKEMQALSKKTMPQMNKAFATPDGVANVGGGQNVNITDNRRFNGGMGAKELRVALDNRLEKRLDTIFG